MNVTIFRRDVIVAQQHQFRIAHQFLFQPVVQRPEPAQFILIFVGIDALAVGYVDTHDAQVAKGSGDDAFLFILKTGDAGLHIGSLLAAQDRHAVVGSLPNENAVIARRLQFIFRKIGILLLGFLQAQNLDRIGGQPVQHLRQPHFQRIDVPGRQLHQMPSVNPL